jgi:molecular chaperone DnaK
MTITASTKLAETDVKKMVNEAKEYEVQDKQRKEEVEIRNTADSLIYTAEKTKSDLTGKISADLIDKVNAAIVGVKAALGGKDSSQIKSELEKLQKALGEAGSAVYEQAARQQAQQQAGPAGNERPKQETTGPGGEHVVDADFKVKDEK